MFFKKQQLNKHQITQEKIVAYNNRVYSSLNFKDQIITNFTDKDNQSKSDHNTFIKNDDFIVTDLEVLKTKLNNKIYSDTFKKEKKWW